MSADSRSSKSIETAARDLPAAVIEPTSQSPDSLLEGRRLALVIANGEYPKDSRLTDLGGPARDAKAFAAVLGDPEIGGFDVTPLIDRPSSEIQPALQRFLAAAQLHDFVIVYLSCHGVLDVHGHLYFAARNTETEVLESTAMEASWLLRRLDDCGARRQVVILDCCYSGAFTEGTRGVGTDLRRQLIGSGRGRIVLTASRADQVAFEDRDLGGQWAGVFTAGLVDGLSTGNADHNRDGLISVEDAYDYAADFMLSRKARQNPQRFMTEVEGRIYLARSHWGGAPESTSSVESEPLPTAARTVIEEPSPTMPIMLPGSKLHVRLANSFQEGVGRLNDAAFSPDGELLATAGGNGTARFWSITTRTFLRSTPVYLTPTSLSTLAFSPDGTLLATGGIGTEVTLWRTSDASSVRRITGFRAGVRALAFSPDDKYLAIACEDGTIRLSLPITGLISRTFDTDIAPATAVAFSPDGRRLTAAGGDGNVRVWKRSDRALLHTLVTEGDETLSLAFSPDGDLLFTAGDGMVEVWDPGAGSRRSKLYCGDRFFVVCVRVSPDGRLLAAVSEQGAVQLWDIRRAEIVATLFAADAAACAVAFHPSKPILCTAGRNGQVRLWDLTAW